MLVLAACGSDETDISATNPNPADEADQSDTGTSEDNTEEPTDPISSEPPPVELTRGDNTVSLDAWSYCWTAPDSEAGICADGAPPEILETLDGEGPITLTFPADFAFVATVYDADYATEVAKASVVADGEGWQIDPATDGPAVLQIFGNGPEGDVSVSVALG